MEPLHDPVEVSAVTTDQYETQVDLAMTESLNSASIDNSFLDSLTSRAEISKVMGTLGSAAVETDDFFGRDPGLLNTFQDALEPDTLKQVETQLSPNTLRHVRAQLSSIVADPSRGISKEHLSKVWMISPDLARQAIEHNTQLCKHHADNELS